ncbi:hypothetical protein H8K38_06235 [Undibacterium sp. FT79W]|uniref:ORC-CDC6 family AAA ATPase n=1 Tax=Undibacterium sp. FT79W TaxID=2762296 RepID=UPI00164B8BF6|nr:hypothetical protein [Undibacterium sp. FT79W]MBC3877398.1 hypothetical protein [Undibacterium sp. FT79W]
MKDHEISFLRAFNAKEMPDQEVARSFVPSTKFSELAGDWNSLLLGPRGSGKTTLLKMLRLSALRLWDHEKADAYRTAIKFTGIFVPADITWSEMIEALGRRKLAAKLRESIVQSVFCTNVLLALVEAFEARITPTLGAKAQNYRVAEYDPQALRAALSTICEFWGLKPKLISLSGMKAALQSRLLLIQAEVTKYIKRDDADSVQLEDALPFLYLHAITAVETAVNQFDTAINDAAGKWALLFDEFEIAPAEMQDMVFRRFRSAGNKIVYKVGLAPCTAHTMTSLARVSEATSTNDYVEVKLWYPEKKAALAFSVNLFRSICGRSAHESDADPIAIFGTNAFVVDDEDDLGAVPQPYGKGDEWKAVFKSLQIKDESFRSFLENKGIDPDCLDTSPTSLTGNTVRKIAPLVAFRDAFRREGVNATKRGRKKLNFAYSGWEAISAICEGNPRWLIGIMNMMLSAESLNTFSVKPSTQVDKIKEATESFTSMLALAPLASRGIQTQQPIDQLLRHIGEYFFTRLVQDEFVEEPPLSFRIDEKVSIDVQAAIRIAINHGALIHIPDTGEKNASFDDLIGKRFRLAYLLAPRFKLPLRATKYAALSSILAYVKNAKADNVIPTSNQMNLL